MQSAQKTSRPTGPPAISLASLTLPALPPTLLVDVAADSGFDGVGINLLQVWRTVSGDASWFATEIDNIDNALSKRHLKLTHGGHLLLGALDIHVTEHILSAMKRLNASYLILVAAPDATPARIEADLKFVLHHAHDAPMLVEFAPYTGWRGLADALRFIEEQQTTSMTLVIDVLHLVRSNSLPLFMSTESLPIGLIQLCDAPLYAPKQEALQMEARGNRLDVGEGELPLAEIFAKLPSDVPIELEAPCLALRNLTPHARVQRGYRHLAEFLRSQGDARRLLLS